MKIHTIKFRTSTTLHVAPPQGDASRGVRTKPIKVQNGQTITGVTLRPYVENLVEKCDIALSDGSEALGVEYAAFQFVDEVTE